MTNFLTGRIGVKVALIVNFFILIVIAMGTYVLVNNQNRHLENELRFKGENLSFIGAKAISTIMNEAIDNGAFTVKDAFDTDYQPIGNFDPPKYHTKYDAYLDKAILTLQDDFLVDESVIYAAALDRNGYIPTHNSRYQQPITGDVENDRAGNRTKRVFNDPIGLKASQNITPKFLQVYTRDTGETSWDLSSPVYVKGKHWGAFRVGISLKAVEMAKKDLTLTLMGIMAVLLSASVVITFLVVSRSLLPVRALSDTANGLAKGKNLDQEITVTTNDEVGELQKALESLRLSMLIALRQRRK